MLLCCRLRSRRLNQKNPQTQVLFLHLLVTLGPVLTMMVLGDLAILMEVLAVVGVMDVHLIGHLEVLVVGLAIMVGMEVQMTLVVGLGVMALVVVQVAMLAIEVNHPLATLAATDPISGVLVVLD